MALGGGTFLTMNKILPGTYVNFVSVATASATLSDRGIATMPLMLDWGIEGDVFEVTNADFQKYSQKIFGYDYTHEKMKGLRDLFKNITTLYAYRLNGGGDKATNIYATAKHGGTRGNDLSIIISVNADVSSNFDVQTVLDSVVVDEQTVATASALVDNDWVDFKADAVLAETAGTSLTGGTNLNVAGAQHQAYLDKIEAYSYNAMGAVVTDAPTKSLYASFCKRMRDEVGMKFQCVLYGQAADYIGIVNVKNKCLDGAVTSGNTVTYPDEAALVYWVTGIIAGCAVNKSNLNKVYDGEYTVDAAYTQAQLEAAIKAGEFTLHKVGSNIRVLSDINSMVTVSDTQGDIFKENQTIRVCDQIANDSAVLFNTRYLGVVPNDATGRIALWNDIVKLHQELESIRAIENFDPATVTVEQGNTKKAVICTVKDLNIINAMAQLYMSVIIM